MRPTTISISSAVDCPSPRSCENICDQNSFLVWAAIHRNDCERLTAEERRECPMLRCRKRFPDHERMLKHLYSCDQLPIGEYWCYKCERVERFTHSSSPDGNTRRKFGDACVKLTKKIFSKGKDRKNDNMLDDILADVIPPPSCSSFATQQPQLAELPANEIYELDSVELVRESQGLFAGIQYLDTMSEIVDYHPLSLSPTESETFSKQPKDKARPKLSMGAPAPLAPDFTDPHTFQFLDQAIKKSPSNYECPYCSYTPRASTGTSFKTYLRKHIKTHHRQDHPSEDGSHALFFDVSRCHPERNANMSSPQGSYQTSEAHYPNGDNIGQQDDPLACVLSIRDVCMAHEINDPDPSLDDPARPHRNNHGSANFLRRRNALKGKSPGHADTVWPEVSKPDDVPCVGDIAEAPEKVDLIPEARRDSMDIDDPPDRTFLSSDTNNHLSRVSEASDDHAQANVQELRNGPDISQWITLWRLRHDLRELYRGLMRVTHVSDFPRARKVRRLYNNATHMLETGLSTFLEVLDGTAPTTLQKVLAFVAVSQVMWNAVRNENASRGVVNHHDSLDGFSTWRLAVVDSQDQLVLDRIAYELWDVPIPSTFCEDDTQTGSLVDSGLTDLWAHPLSYSGIPESLINNSSIAPTPLQTFQDDVSLLLSTTAVHTNLLFSDFLHVPGLEGNLRPKTTTSTTDGVRSSPRRSNGGNIFVDSGIFTRPPSDSWGDFGYVPGIDGTINPECLRLGDSPKWDSSTQPLNMNSQSNLMGLPPQALGSTTDIDGATGVLQCLIGTILFQVVVIFLRIMSHTGSILQIMSGCTSIKPSNTSEGLGGKNASESSGSFLAEMREHAIEPLRLKFSKYHTHFIGLLESGYSLIKLGCIKSLQEFEKYLVHASLHSSKSKKDFMFLVQSVLSQCLKCSSKMSWNDLYPDGLYADEYSTRYVDRRMGEEQGTADAIFPDQGTTDASSSEAVSKSATSRTSKSPPNSISSSPSSKTDTADSVSSRQGKIERCSHQGCGKVYTGVDARVNLRRHVRCTHEPSKWTCPGSGCELATPRRDNLRKHFKTKHPGETMPPWLGNRKRC